MSIWKVSIRLDLLLFFRKAIGASICFCARSSIQLCDLFTHFIKKTLMSKFHIIWRCSRLSRSRFCQYLPRRPFTTKNASDLQEVLFIAIHLIVQLVYTFLVTLPPEDTAVFLIILFHHFVNKNHSTRMPDPHLCRNTVAGLHKNLQVSCSRLSLALH